MNHTAARSEKTARAEKAVRAEKRAQREQYAVLRLVEERMETPMFVLSLLWAGLLVWELIWGLTPAMQSAVTGIWVVFLLEFAIKLIIAPNRLKFLRKSWLSVFALAIPALRVFRVAKVVAVLRYGRAVRGLTLARVLTAFNRGLRTLRQSLGRFGVGYILGLTFLVANLGSAGIYFFERQQPGGIQTFGDALWFTAMMLTTSGSDQWPQSPEGRVLCFLLALYAFAIFGYVTATIATLLLGQEQRARAPARPQRRRSGVERETLAELQNQIAALNERLDRQSGAGP